MNDYFCNWKSKNVNFAGSVENDGTWKVNDEIGLGTVNATVQICNKNDFLECHRVTF